MVIPPITLPVMIAVMLKPLLVLPAGGGPELVLELVVVGSVPGCDEELAPSLELLNALTPLVVPGGSTAFARSLLLMMRISAPL